ncbi:MAG: endonuclease/exonuclease/phosphatase family protein, partial [Verrucomicrobiota bacterium]
MMRWVCAGLLVICLTSFFPGGQALPRAGRKMDELRAFRLFTYNVLVSATNYEEVIRTVREQSPDVALFLEVDVSWADALAVLEGEYPYFDVEASGAFGLAMYSRVPLEEVIIEDVSGYGFVSVMADLEWEGTPVRVVGTHPPPPIDAFSWKVQQTHLDELAEIICKERRPVLIGGDFNCAPWTQTALRFGRKGRILRSTRSWRATWSSAFREGFGLPLDHHWGSPEWRVKEHRFGPFQESDHRWIMTDFVLPEGSKEGG